MAIDTNTPTFVERDPAVIMAESKAKLEEVCWGVSCNPHRSSS